MKNDWTLLTLDKYNWSHAICSSIVVSFFDSDIILDNN